MDCSVCQAPGMCVCPPAQPWQTRIATQAVLDAVGAEVQSAEAKFPPFNSAHEGFAIMLEEVDELKGHVWTNQKRRDLHAMRQEAVQVAAMAVRFIRDVCDAGRGRV